MQENKLIEARRLIEAKAAEALELRAELESQVAKREADSARHSGAIAVLEQRLQEEAKVGLTAHGCPEEYVMYLFESSISWLINAGPRGWPGCPPREDVPLHHCFPFVPPRTRELRGSCPRQGVALLPINNHNPISNHRLAGKAF